MRVIIAGSRIIEDYDVVLNAIKKSKFEITTVVSGMARGADKLAVMYAEQNKIPLIPYFADWDKHGKSAGILRNIEMAKNADALIAIIKNGSKGTSHMISEAKRKGLKIYVKEV